MNEKGKIKLYQDFIKEITRYAFPNIPLDVNYIEAEKYFFKLNIIEISNLLRLKGSILLENHFKFNLNCRNNSDEHIAKSRALRQAYDVFLSCSKIDWSPDYQESSNNTKVKQKKSKQNIKPKGGRENKMILNKSHKKVKPYNRKKKPWEKEKDYNLYGNRAKVFYVPMKG